MVGIRAHEYHRNTDPPPPVRFTSDTELSTADDMLGLGCFISSKLHGQHGQGSLLLSRHRASLTQLCKDTLKAPLEGKIRSRLIVQCGTT
ncbi:hypothetical protein Q8A67_011482 [Cirrhinus molitorella]|uniref:Uncharacterized protein n=1 Tax=Cirrhinus molitorella TaxID=172907 RepID=A0AA88TY37_9TELE|nr:hypothetical protein Q8A67_011482 [Cirrhinus molitorella]